MRERHDLTTADLLKEFRQVSAALWNQLAQPGSEQAAELLTRREELLQMLPEPESFQAADKRELRAILAADRYLMRQFENELNFLAQRLDGLRLRRQAAQGYQTGATPPRNLSRIG